MGSPFALKHGKNGTLVFHSSSTLQHSQEIPTADSLRDKAEKIGQLKKLSGRGILTSGTWRERHCLLVKTRLYFFDNQESDGSDKSSGFVNLDYFDNCSQVSTKISRKGTHYVFVIGASDKGFFESHSGRHYFAAESLSEMKEWVSAINSAMNKIRPKDKRTQQLRDKSPHLSPIATTKTKENGSRMVGTKAKSSSTTVDIDSIQEVTGTLPRPSSTRLDCALAKSRVKGPAGRRLPRKPSHQSPSLASSSYSSGRKKVKAVIEKSEDDDEDDLEDLDDKESVRGNGEDDNNKIRASLSTLEKNLVNGDGDGERQTGNNSNQSQKSSTSSGSGTTSNPNSNSNSSEKKSITMMRNSRTTTGENWRNSRSMDFHEPHLMDKPFASNHCMTYRYSSSSDESLNISEDNGNLGAKKMDFDSFSPNKSIPPRTPIFRGSTIRHSSVTPPCVLRRMKRDYSANNTPRSSKDLDLDDSMDSFMPEIGSGARRTSSGSSLSTLTAEPHNGFSRHISFSSLQREPKHHHQADTLSNLYQTINNGSLSRGSSSANASPLMTSHHHSSSGGGSVLFRNHLSHGHHSHAHSGSGSSTSHSSSASRSSPLDRNIKTIKQDLGAVVLETRQLDVDVNSLRQDVGSVQENIATVRGALDMTRERVGRLSNQVVNIERQISVIAKEANLMRDQAAKLLEEAETSKASHENLQEEAENLLSFLRQMASSSSCHQAQRNHSHCCKTQAQYSQQCNNHGKSMTLSGSNTINHNGGQSKFFPQPAPRMRHKTPERTFDENHEGKGENETEIGHQRSLSVVKFSDDCKGDSSSCESGTNRISGCEFNLNLTDLTETGNKKTFSNDDHEKDDSSDQISLLAEI